MLDVILTLAALVVLVGAFAGGVALALRVDRRRYQRIVEAHPDGWTWLVGTSLGSFVLLIDGNQISMLSRKGKPVFAWPRSSLRHAKITSVRMGAVPRPGMHLEFGNHEVPPSIELAFGGIKSLWSSRRLAQSVVDVLNRPEPGA